MVSLLVVNIYDDFYEYNEKEGKQLSTLKSLKATRNHMIQCCTNNPILDNNFTDKIPNAIIIWMVSNFEYQPNSLGLHTKNLNTFFHWCEKVRKIQLSPEVQRLRNIS